MELLDGLVDPGDVTERDLGRVDRHPLGAGLAERHHLRAAALDLVHQEDPEPDEDDEGQDVGQQREPAARARALDVEVLGREVPSGPDWRVVDQRARRAGGEADAVLRVARWFSVTSAVLSLSLIWSAWTLPRSSCWIRLPYV